MTAKGRQRYEFRPEFAIYPFGMRYAFASSPKARYAKKRDMCLRPAKRNSYHIAFAQQIYRVLHSKTYRAAKRHIASDRAYICNSVFLGMTAKGRQRYEFRPEFAIYPFGMRYAFASSPKARYAKKRDMRLRPAKRNSYHIAFAQQIYRVLHSKTYRAAKRHIASDRAYICNSEFLGMIDHETQNGY